MPKKKDSLIIGAVLLIAVVLFIVSRVMPKTDLNQKTADVTLAPDAVEYLDATPEASAEPTDSPEATPEPTAVPEETAPAEATAMPAAETSAPIEVTVEPTAEATEAPQSANMMGPMPVPQTEEVKGHVIITVGGRQYGDPIPMDRDKIITIRQENGEINKIRITPDSVDMEYSTCENQDCIGEGTITLDNYNERILGTWIICLPNQVTIEMVPADK